MLLCKKTYSWSVYAFIKQHGFFHILFTLFHPTIHFSSCRLQLWTDTFKDWIPDKSTVLRLKSPSRPGQGRSSRIPLETAVTMSTTSGRTGRKRQGKCSGVRSRDYCPPRAGIWLRIQHSVTVTLSWATSGQRLNISGTYGNHPLADWDTWAPSKRHPAGQIPGRSLHGLNGGVWGIKGCCLVVKWCDPNNGTILPLSWSANLVYSHSLLPVSPSGHDTALLRLYEALNNPQANTDAALGVAGHLNTTNLKTVMPDFYQHTTRRTSIFNNNQRITNQICFVYNLQHWLQMVFAFICPCPLLLWRIETWLGLVPKRLALDLHPKMTWPWTLRLKPSPAARERFDSVPEPETGQCAGFDFPAISLVSWSEM